MNYQLELSENTEVLHDPKECYIRDARIEAVRYALEHGEVASDVLTTQRPAKVHPNASGSIFRGSGLFRAVRPKKSVCASRRGGFIWVWELVDREKATEFLSKVK